ncbi:methyltransferase domain-containing protein [Chlorogloeopsis sp. ULAP02]|uniref:methyltransferase domain-containing protein n=1 Tax=Chlorogloeopsis sp. ULAP02 TaxID=3107926 RepID=UPI003134D76F
MPENYTPGYSPNAINFMARRTAASHAAFFLPYLRPGMHILDCGCGPGTITLGLASAIAPGKVTAIDKADSQILNAWDNAKKQEISNVDFISANIYALPFVENSFDAVFAHAVFEHLQKPVQALRELWRVLKPEGIIGVRSPDWGGFLMVPTTPTLDRAIDYCKFLQQQNGGNPCIGRELRALLRQAGFINVKATATYECYEPLSLPAEYLALRIEASAEIEQAIDKGWVDGQASLLAMSESLREWSQHPDGFFAQTWCEVVGKKSV